jgi:integrase
MATIRNRNGRWQALVRYKGFPPETKTFQRKEDAARWAREVERELDLKGFYNPIDTQTTLSELLERYSQEVTKHHKSARWSAYMATQISDFIGELQVCHVTPERLSAYRDKRLLEIKPQTVTHELNFIGRVFKKAIREWGLIMPNGNPADVIYRPKLPRGRDRRVTPEEYALLKVTPKIGHLIELAVETGMRRGELMRVQWRDLNLIKRTLHIPETKTDTPRTIPLTNRATEIFQSLPRNIDGKVFHMPPDVLTHRFRMACEIYGIEGLRFHDLRHEATSRFFEMGLNVMEVSSITGHKDLTMLQRYTHLRAEDIAMKIG